MPTTPVAPPAPAKKSLTKTILTDVTVVLTSAVTVAEGVLVTLPAGVVTSALQVAIPAVAALAAGLRQIGG